MNYTLKNKIKNKTKTLHFKKFLNFLNVFAIKLTNRVTTSLKRNFKLDLKIRLIKKNWIIFIRSDVVMKK